jgi:hypothetical protein
MTFNYTIKAHPTNYGGTLFRSRLEARWAAFFDLAGWKWEYEPIDFVGWTPDFLISYYCGHSDCDPYHSLYIEVKPYSSIDQFNGHPCRPNGYSIHDGPGAFGLSPEITEWCLTHGAGGGTEDVTCRVEEWERLWREAGNKTQWQHPSQKVFSGSKVTPQQITDLFRKNAGVSHVSDRWYLSVGGSCRDCGNKREDEQDEEYCACPGSPVFEYPYIRMRVPRCGLCGDPKCPKPNPGSRDAAECLAHK